MSRFATILISLTLLLPLSYCTSEEEEKAMNKPSTDDARFEQIITAINSKDKEVLISLFSTQALDNAINIDEGIEYLHSIPIDNNVSWEREKRTVRESIRDGYKSQLVVSWYIVDSEQERYLFIIIDYAVDTINPNNEGLYTIYAILESERESRYQYWTDIMVAGIYVPD